MDAAVNTNLPNSHRNFHKRRRRANKKEKGPKVPKAKNLEELANCFDAGKHFLKYNFKAGKPRVPQYRSLQSHTIVDSRGKKHLALYDEDYVKEVIDQPGNTLKLFIDGTFSVRPRRCGKQMLSIMVKRGMKVGSKFRRIYKYFN